MSAGATASIGHTSFFGSVGFRVELEAAGSTAATCTHGFPLGHSGQQCPVLPQLKHCPSLMYLAQLLDERVVPTRATPAFTCMVTCCCGSVALWFGLGLYLHHSAPMCSSSREMVSDLRLASTLGCLPIRSCFISHVSPL